MSSYVDPLNPGGSSASRRLGPGIRGGRSSLPPSITVDPLNPGGEIPRVQPQRPTPLLSKTTLSGKPSTKAINLPKDLAYQARTGADVISTNSSLSAQQKKEAEDRLVAQFESRNLPAPYLAQIKDIIYQRRAYGESQNQATAQTINRVLGAVSNAQSGFLRGTHEFQKSKGITSWQDQWKYAAHPAYIYKEFAAGFKDVPDAVKNQYTMDQMIKDTTTPGSFSYRYAMPIGLGMSVLFDPTSYLSVGATSASKSVAYHTLAESDKFAYKAADEIIKKNFGKKIETAHGPVIANYHNLDEIVSDVKVRHNLPFTLGDALDKLQAANLGMKQEIRQTGKFWDPQAREFVDATGRQKVAARLLPNNVKGGRGVRFAGKMIPGTDKLGEKMSTGLLNQADQGGLVGDLGTMFVPQWGARHVVEDGARASALVEFSKFKTGIQKAQTDIGRNVRELQRPMVPIEHDGGEDLLHSVASDHPQFQRVLVRPDQREELFKMPDSVLSPAQKILKNNISVTAEEYIQRAAKAGLNEKEIRRLWDHTMDYYKDPLMALAEFKFKSTARTMVKTFTEDILRDRRFAMPLNSKEAVHQLEKRDWLESDINLGLLDHPPAGWSEYNIGGRRFAVRDSIYDALKTINNPTALDSSLQRGFRRLNMLQDWWKLYATSPNPAFHVMNFLGAVWNNLLAGVYNPVDYFDALATLYRGRKEEAAQVGAKFGITRKVPESTEKGRAAHKLLSEAEARSGLGRSSFLFADVSRGHYTPEQLAMSDRPIAEDAPMFEKFAGEGLDRGKGFVKGQLTPKPGFSKKRTYGITVPRKAAGVALAAHANPLAFAMFMPEIARAGRRVGGTIEDLVRLTPFMKYSDDPAIRRALAEYGPINSSLQIHYKNFSKADQQTMYDIGANITAHFQFDYSDLTQFERYIAKTIFPFWVYYKKNLALQVAQLAKRPLPFMTAQRLMNYSNENSGMELGPYKEILPAYFNNLNAFQVPVPGSVRKQLGLPKDQPLYLNPKLPFLSLNLIPNLWEVLRDPNQTTSQKMLSVLAPTFGSIGPFAPLPFPGAKILLEAGTGHNLGLNRPIDYQRASSNDYRQGYLPAPSWMKYLPSEIRKDIFHVSKNPRTGKLEITQTANYVLQQMSSPFINNLGQSIPISGANEGEQDKARANLVSWLTGVRLMPVDVLRLDRNAAYDLKNRLESKQSELRSRGSNLSTEDQLILAHVKADLEVINAAYKQREVSDNP